MEQTAYTKDITTELTTIPELKRKVAKAIEFFVPGTFQSMYAANQWCRENGYSYGSSCAPCVYQGLLNGENILIAKWKNLTKEEIAQLDGVMISVGDRREGAMRVVIFEK